MTDLLDILNNDSDIVYRKCGEVVVAPKRNVFALYCIFCQDIFVHVQEFIRHVKRLHDDEFEFEKNEQDMDIYSIEELMDGMSNNDIIAQEELEWARRKRFNCMLENPEFELYNGNETDTDEFTNMEYSEDEKNSSVIGKVECDSQEMVQSKEEYGVIYNELESEKYTQERNYSSVEEYNPDLDDLLNELDDDLDCHDISIIKKLRHNLDKSMSQTETNNKDKICNKKKELYSILKLNKSAENVANNNYKSNFDNLELTTEVNNTITGNSKGFLDQWSQSSNSFKTVPISEPQYILQKNKQKNSPILPKSEYCKSQVITESIPFKKAFHKINENKQHKPPTQNIVGKNENKMCNNVKLNVRKDFITQQHFTSVDSSNNELLREPNSVEFLMMENKIPKLKNVQIEENSREAITQTHQKDVMLNKTTLTNEEQFNKMLKVRIKKISPSLSTEESPEMKINETNEKIHDDKVETNLKSKSRRSLRIKQNPSVDLSPVKKKSPLATNKVTAPKTEVVPMEAYSPIKNIFCKQNFTEQSVRGDVLKKKDSSIEPQAQIVQSKRKPFTISRQRKASIDVLQQTPLNNSNLELDRTTRKNQVLERMTQIRKRITKIIDKENVVRLQPEKTKNNIEITNVTILPVIESIRSKYDSTPFDAFIKPKVKSKDRDAKPQTLNKVSKNKQNSFVNQVKVDIFSPNEMHKNERELTKLDLSESVLEFLQDDFCQNKLHINQLDSILETAPTETEYNADGNLSIKNKYSSSSTSILEELLDQVDKETKAKEFTVLSNRTIKEESSHKFNSENPIITKSEVPNAENVCSDGYKTTHDEIKLLSKVGLTILKTPQHEKLPVQEEELLRFKAKQFADILRNLPSVWQPRRLKDKNTTQLNSLFLEMTTKINSAFKTNFNSIETKRIFNLIMSWYTKQSNRKWLDKKSVSATLQYYTQLFSFLPKTGRPIYNCEFCDQQYRSEAAYSIHRCTHTGGLAYSCFYCDKGFVKSTSHKIHERSHLDKKDENKNRKSTKTANNADFKYIPKENLEKSNKYLKRSRSPENKTENIIPKRFQANETKSDSSIIQHENANGVHNNQMMLQLKRKFECKLCKKVLPTAKDMSNHLYKHVLKTK